MTQLPKGTVVARNKNIKITEHVNDYEGVNSKVKTTWIIREDGMLGVYDQETNELIFEFPAKIIQDQIRKAKGEQL